MFIDSHCHLDRLNLSLYDNNLDNVIQSAIDAKVRQLLCVSVTLDEFKKMKEQTKSYPNVLLSCGTHPLNQESFLCEDKLLELSSDKNVIAIGETGLDYFYAPKTKELQIDSFKKHISVAKQLKKPLIIHTRGAQQDTLDILKEEGAEQVGGVLHCFTESWEMAEQAMALGFYISFSGIVTFKNASALRKIAALVPDDKFLIETDAPYLAPVPHRGKENQPAFVVEVAKHLASVRGQSVETIAKFSTDNFKRLFNLNSD